MKYETLVKKGNGRSFTRNVRLNYQHLASIITHLESREELHLDNPSTAVQTILERVYHSLPRSAQLPLETSISFCLHRHFIKDASTDSARALLSIGGSPIEVDLAEVAEAERLLAEQLGETTKTPIEVSADLSDLARRPNND